MRFILPIVAIATLLPLASLTIAQDMDKLMDSVDTEKAADSAANRRPESTLYHGSRPPP